MGEKYTDAQKRASMKYLAEKTESLQLRLPKGKKEEYKQQALSKGEKSLTAYIIRLIENDKSPD